MKTYVIRRVLQLIPVLFGISVLIFAVMKMIPGDVIVGHIWSVPGLGQMTHTEIGCAVNRPSV